MPANQEPLNRIEIVWYHFTPRNISYLMVLLNMGHLGEVRRKIENCVRLVVYVKFSHCGF